MKLLSQVSILKNIPYTVKICVINEFQKIAKSTVIILNYEEFQ